MNGACDERGITGTDDDWVGSLRDSGVCDFLKLST